MLRLSDDPLKTEWIRLFEEMDTAALSHRLATRPDSWTIAQIAEHLMITYDGSSQLFEAVLRRGRCMKRPLTLQQRLQQFYVLNLGHLPAGRVAPADLQPREIASQTAQQTLDVAMAKLSQMYSLLEQMRVTFGPVRCAAHHVLGIMTPDGWRRFHLLHGRNHLRQIEAILKQRSPQK